MQRLIQGICVVFLTFSAFAEPPSPASVSIEVGSLAAPDSSEQWLTEEVKRFQAAHPEIDVKTTSFTRPLRREYPLASNPPLAADVIGIDSALGYETPFLVERGLLVPIEQFLPDPEFTLDAYYPNYWEPVTYKGKHWGVPWYVVTDLLVCDWPLFEQAGIKNPPKTWQEWQEAARKLTKDTDGDGQVDQWGLRISTRDDAIYHLLFSMIVQKGGFLMRGGRMDVAHPAVKETTTAINEFAIKSGFVRLDSRPLAEVLADPKVRHAMHLVPLSLLGKSAFNPRLRLAPLPTAGGDISVSSRRLYFAIRKSTPEREQAAWSFVKWMTRKDITMPSTLEGYPCRKDFVEREEFRALAGKAAQDLPTILTCTANAVEPGDYAINRMTAFELLGLSMGPVLKGTVAFEQVVPQAAEEATKLLKPISSPAENRVLYEPR